MTTRSQDRPQPDAQKTTQQSMIAAIGASGAVIAGGVTTFILLVGVVSFDVWPMSDGASSGGSEVLRLVELPPEPEPEAGSGGFVTPVPFGSGVLVTDPAIVSVPGKPERSDRPKLAGNGGIGSGEAPPTPVAQAPGDGGDSPSGGGTVSAGAEEPIPQEPASDDAGDDNDGPQRPSRPSRPPRPSAPAPAPAPVTSGAGTVSGGGSDSGGGAGGSGSSGNGNHGGQG